MKQACVRLALATHTPIGWWLEQPVEDLPEWIELVAAELKKP